MLSSLLLNKLSKRFFSPPVGLSLASVLGLRVLAEGKSSWPLVLGVTPVRLERELDASAATHSQVCSATPGL